MSASALNFAAGITALASVLLLAIAVGMLIRKLDRPDPSQFGIDPYTDDEFEEASNRAGEIARIWAEIADLWSAVAELRGADMSADDCGCADGECDQRDMAKCREFPTANPADDCPPDCDCFDVCKRELPDPVTALFDESTTWPDGMTLSAPSPTFVTFQKIPAKYIAETLGRPRTTIYAIEQRAARNASDHVVDDV